MELTLYPIGILVRWRYAKFMSEFNINTFKFNHNDKRKENWIRLKKQLISQNYVTDTDSFIHCFMVINNIIWKNIINHSVSSVGVYNYNWHLHMLYIDIEQIKIHYFPEPYINKYMLLTNSQIIDNLCKMQNIIINYFLLINSIVTSHMISDLSEIIKMHMYNIMLL